MTENQTPSPWGDDLDRYLEGEIRKDAWVDYLDILPRRGWLDSISWMHRYEYQGPLWLEMTPEDLERFRARFEESLQDAKQLSWGQSIPLEMDWAAGENLSDYLDRIKPEQ